jgi:hypothetical protein
LLVQASMMPRTIELGRRHPVAGKEHPPHQRTAKQRVEHRGTAGEPDIDLGHAEHGLFGGVEDVAGRHQAEAGTERDAR